MLVSYNYNLFFEVSLMENEYRFYEAIFIYEGSFIAFVFKVMSLNAGQSQLSYSSELLRTHVNSQSEYALQILV